MWFGLGAIYIVLMITHGYMHSWFQQASADDIDAPLAASVDFGAPEVFVPQFVRAKRRAAKLAVVGAVALAGLIVWWLG